MPQQNKIKWLDVDSGKDVGFMNVKKAENKQELQGTEEKTFVEEFKNVAAIPTMQGRGAIITTEEGAVAAQKGMALEISNSKTSKIATRKSNKKY